MPDVDYRALLESVHAIVWRADARTFQTTFASKEAEDILGYPAASWTDVPGFWVSRIHPEDRARVLELTSAETRHGRFHDFEYRAIAASGEVLWLHNITNVISRDGEPVELVGVTVDITARKRIELEADRLRQELIRVARAATLGEVAATLAHEVNQPLGAIAVNAETLQRLLHSGPAAAPERLAAIAEDIRLDAQRAGEIIHRVRAFLEHQPPRRRPLDLASLVEWVLRTVGGLLTRHHVVCTVEIAPTLPPASGDAVQVQQVVVNLIRNAIEAIVERDPQNRSIVIRARPCGVDRIELSVSDTGRGFAAEILPRLFEPFATTKAGGLGMGLAVSRRIVEADGGDIHVASSPDGATVTFTLPVHTAAGGSA